MARTCEDGLSLYLVEFFELVNLKSLNHLGMVVTTLECKYLGFFTRFGKGRVHFFNHLSD